MSSSSSRLSRRALIAATAASAFAASARRVRANEASGICLQPLGGGVPEKELSLVRQALEAVYAPPVSVLANVELPRSAFYAPRGRYRAEKLLQFLRSRLPGGAGAPPDDGTAAVRIVGITAADISTTKPPYEDWGILGLATIDGIACVLSTFRCHRRAKSAEHARVRFGKTAVHEIGHTFGLEHCPNSGCLMEDGAGSVLTTDRERDLCDACRRRLAGRAILREPPGALPW